MQSKINMLRSSVKKIVLTLKYILRWFFTDRDYFKLHRWSCENYPEFWAELWAFCDVKASAPFEEVVDRTKKISDFPQWFAGARLNFAENLLKWADVEPNKVALYFAGKINFTK